jgi:hypothetical protein
MSVFCTIDDKKVPLYRIIWVSDLPHYCGEPDCEREGQYEVRLEGGESVWAIKKDRDETMELLESWLQEEEEDAE